MNLRKNDKYDIRIVFIFAFIAFFIFIGLLAIIKKTCFTYETPVNKVYSGIINNTMPVVNSRDKDYAKLDSSFSKIIGMNSKDYLSVLGKEIAYLSADEEYKSLEDERSEERRVGKECRSRWSPY